MNKFRIGEKVRVKSFEERPVGWVPVMDRYMGTIQTVSVLHSHGDVGIDGWIFDESEIRKLNFIERIFAR